MLFYASPVLYVATMVPEDSSAPTSPTRSPRSSPRCATRSSTRRRPIAGHGDRRSGADADPAGIVVGARSRSGLCVFNRDGPADRRGAVASYPRRPMSTSTEQAELQALRAPRRELERENAELGRAGQRRDRRRAGPRVLARSLGARPERADAPARRGGVPRGGPGSARRRPRVCRRSSGASRDDAAGRRRRARQGRCAVPGRGARRARARGGRRGAGHRFGIARRIGGDRPRRGGRGPGDRAGRLRARPHAQPGRRADERRDRRLPHPGRDAGSRLACRAGRGVRGSTRGSAPPSAPISRGRTPAR